MTQYLKISIKCSLELQDILIAELGLIKYDSFQELNEGIEAFIEERLFQEDELKEVLDKYNIALSFKKELLQDINWNEEWEKNFDPVYVGSQVQIRAAFHEEKAGFNHEIIINPKMSFGTGHHETTHLMVSEQQSINHENKRVLDVGTGTGVLAIMADKLRAKSIIATDVDNWSIENCKENFVINKVSNFEILQGTIDNLTLTSDFDIIYANINKNVLLSELPIYSSLLAKDGILVLSGFYSEDIDDLKEIAVKNKLHFKHSKIRNNWAMMFLTRLDS